MLELKVHALNVKFGTIDAENGRPEMDWAKISIIEDESVTRNGFAGVSVGELSVDTSDGNRLAKKIHSAVTHNSLFPANVTVLCDHQVKGKNVQLLVKDIKELNKPS